jgi:YbgC/YbaW family acyl-CoA thioester hydrolase
VRYAGGQIDKLAQRVKHESGKNVERLYDSGMATTFRTTHRVEFHETDMAGIVHFSNFFRYMEVAEVAFLRSCGLHVSWHEGPVRYGFPRVSATCDFFKPARFEEEIEIHVAVEQVGAKSVTYSHEFRRGEDVLARGRITAVYVRVGDDRKLHAAEIPPEIRAKLLGEAS